LIQMTAELSSVEYSENRAGSTSFMIVAVKCFGQIGGTLYGVQIISRGFVVVVDLTGVQR